MSKTLWTVEVRTTVVKEMVCEGGTEEEVRADPYKFYQSYSELELKVIDCEVLSVKFLNP